jgi:hypothetical protein
MRRPVVSAAAATMLAGAVALAVPSSARLVLPQAAGLVTTVTVGHSGTADLVLYDDATLSPAVLHNPDVQISGSGRLVGFELSRTDGDGDFLAAVRMPSFAGGQVQVGGSTTPAVRCTPWPNATVDLSQTCTHPHTTAITLHEGYYHLVALADGAPLTITLHLHGQAQRSARVHLQSSFRSVEALLPERESMGSSTVTYGTDVAFAGATQVFDVVAATLHPKATVLADSLCVRSDSGAPPPYAFSPACPGGSSSGMSYRLADSQAGGGGIVFVGVPGSTHDPNGLGGSFTDSDGPTYLGGLGVWLSGTQLSFLGGFAPAGS